MFLIFFFQFPRIVATGILVKVEPAHLKMISIHVHVIQESQESFVRKVRPSSSFQDFTMKTVHRMASILCSLPWSLLNGNQTLMVDSTLTAWFTKDFFFLFSDLVNKIYYVSTKPSLKLSNYCLFCLSPTPPPPPQ